VLFLDGHAFGEFHLELIVIDGLAGHLDRHVLCIRCFKHTRNVIGDAHQVDGGRTLVLQDQGGMELLRPVRAEAGRRVGLGHFRFQHLEFLLLQRHRSFRGAQRLGKDGVGELVGEIRLVLSHDNLFLRLPLAVGCNVFVNIVNIKQKVVVALHADLQSREVNGEGGAVLENGLANPVVGSLIFANTHVGEASTERIEFTERHAGQR